MNVMQYLPVIQKYRPRNCVILVRFLCDKSSNSQTTVGDKTDKGEPPEEPATCCMSGCVNCVWLRYAEALSAYYRDGGEKARSEILEKVQNPNIREYLLHELRMRAQQEKEQNQPPKT